MEMEDEIEEEDGLVTIKVSPEEAKRLRSLLARKDNLVKKPRVHREGNRIVIDTGLDEYCTFNKGTPQEIHAEMIFTRAQSHDINANNEVVNIVSALTVVQRVEGGFCYMSGKPVNKLEDLEIIPKGPLRQAAIDWFNAKYHPGEEGSKKHARG